MKHVVATDCLSGNSHVESDGISGTMHMDTSRRYNNFGDVYKELGEYVLALEYYYKSLGMRKDIYGSDSDHPDLAISYNNIGSVYDNTGDYELALEYYNKSL